MEPTQYKREPPPALRQENQPDELDDKRAQWAWTQYTKQDALYRLYDRSIEENTRMLAGQQWYQYHQLLGWKNVTDWMTDEERRWRQRPVFNRILPWFILTHARMTENPFICTFLPGPDERDAQLAEIYDALYKGKWREAGMVDVWDRCAAWMIVAGAAFLQSRLDLTKGPWEHWVGTGAVPVMNEVGEQVLDPTTLEPAFETLPDIPFDRDGRPLAELHPDGLKVTGKPYATRRGSLVVDVFSPLEVRGEWGPLPWHMQRRHHSRSYLTPEQVFDKWGVECEPDIRGDGGSFVERVLFGTGFFGAASAMVGSEFSQAGNMAEGLCCVQTTWEAPNRRLEGMEEQPDTPGGRLLITTRTKVLRDGPRPHAYPYTSPLRCFPFIRLPGRHGGSTPQEILNSPQRAYNTGWKQLLEHRALSTNPQQVYDLRSGLSEDQVDNRPGRRYGVHMRQHVKPVDWVAPPSISGDVWKIQADLAEEMNFLGATQGTQPLDIAKDASGQLVRELRFNDDRFLGPTMRRSAEEMGRLIEDWQVIWPTIHDQEEVLHYTGDDNVARTIVLMPEIFTAAKADVVPDTESMLPEGRGERRARIYKMWQDGAFGPPVSMPALRKLHELVRFPHMSRVAKPGGVHWTTAEQENGELLRGGIPPTFDWYDDAIHLVVLEEFMASPEWRRLDPNIKLGFVIHRQEHQIRLAQKTAAKMEDELTAAAIAQDLNSGGAARNGGGPAAPAGPAQPPERRPTLAPRAG